MAKKRYNLKSGYFEFEGDNVVELLTSQEMQAILAGYGKAVQTRAGSGYVGEAKVYKKRAAYNVSAETVRAKRDNLNNNTLLKALGGGK